MQKLTEWMNSERGRQAKLAAACRVTHSAVSQWTKVPGERLPIVSRVTGIPMKELRPDLYEGQEEAAE